LDDSNASSKIIAEKCAQIRNFRDSRGVLSEPVWYRALGVFAFCEDGDEFAHQISSGDPRYSKTETQDKLDRARGFGPTTCAKFHGLDSAVCERCPHWGKIKSPIVLGREQSRVHENVESGPKERGERDEQPQTNQQEQASKSGEEQKNNHSSEAKSESAFSIRWHGEEGSSDKRKWLIKHLLYTTGVGLISGQWGSAKTFVAIDLAGSAMMGNPFAGRPVKCKGGVLFIAAEGASEIPIRLCALIKLNTPVTRVSFHSRGWKVLR